MPETRLIIKKKKKKKKKRKKKKKHAKENFYNNLELSLSDIHNNDKKKFWQVIRHLVKNKNTSGSVPPLITFSDGNRNIYCFSDEEKAECLNNFFTSISNVDDSKRISLLLKLNAQTLCLNFMYIPWNRDTYQFTQP